MVNDCISADNALPFHQVENGERGALILDPAVEDLLDGLTCPRRMPTSAREQIVLAAAEHQLLSVAGHDIATWTWTAVCTAAPKLLLVHGWEGRASHWGSFIVALTRAGYSVRAFDAPAHGASEGRFGGIVPTGRAVLGLAEQWGSIDGVITHSAGSASALYAIARGLRIRASVHLAGSSSLTRMLRLAVQRSGLSAPQAAQFFTGFAQRLGHAVSDADLDNLKAGLEHQALLLHDVADRKVPYAESEALHAAWPGAILRSIPEVGHRRMLRNGSVVSQTIEFLSMSLPPVG